MLVICSKKSVETTRKNTNPMRKLRFSKLGLLENSLYPKNSEKKTEFEKKLRVQEHSAVTK